MAENKRIFFAVEQVCVGRLGTVSWAAAANLVRGAQSVGMNTNFNLEQVFQIGQLSIYENIEEIPDVEVTIEKVLDGYPLIYHLATRDASTGSLAGRSNEKCIVGLSLYGDTQNAASGTPFAEVQTSGSYVSNLSYTFPVQGNCTEAVTLLCNHKVWNTGVMVFSGLHNETDSPVLGSGGVQRRENIIFAPYAASAGGATHIFRPTVYTKLPQDIPGISSSGTNEKDSDGNYKAHVQNITVSADLGREPLFELGRKAPYHRYVTFPIQVSCDIEIIATKGDLVSATEAGVLASGSNLADRAIIVRTEEGTIVDLGGKNKLSRVSYSGGETGGSNVSVTFSYITFNDLIVAHARDPNASLSA